MNKKRLLNIVFALLAVVVFYFIYQKTDWVQTLKVIRNAHVAWSFFAFGSIMLAHFLRALRWNMLTEPQGYKLNTRRSFYAVMIGYLVNVATSRGGEIVRCAAASKTEKAPVDFLVGTVITERIIDLLVLVSFCLLCLAVEFENLWHFIDTYVLQKIEKVMPVWLAGLILVAIGIGIARWLKNRKTSGEGIVQRLLTGVRSVFNLKNPYLFIVYSVLIWAGYWMGVYGTLKALDITTHLHFWASLSILVFSAVGIAIPLPAGAGVWGAIAFGLTTVYAIPETDANTYGIFNLAVTNLVMIFFGAVAALLWWIEWQKINKADAAQNS